MFITKVCLRLLFFLIFFVTCIQAFSQAGAFEKWFLQVTA